MSAQAPSSSLPAPAPPSAPAHIAAVPTTFRVLAYLTNGESVEIAGHPDETAARAEATALMRFLREVGDWPFVNGRFIRPAAVVSIGVSG
ncbi:MAG: hypothetical protein ACRDN6_11775 [Gaiellaceae bacterium]